MSANDPKRTWPKDRSVSGGRSLRCHPNNLSGCDQRHIAGGTMTAPCRGWSKTGFAMLDPASWRSVQPLLFAAVVGLCCVGRPNGVQAADDEKTALPAFAPWIGDFDGMQQ